MKPSIDIISRRNIIALSRSVNASRSSKAHPHQLIQQSYHYTFTVYNQHTYKGTLAGAGISGFSEAATFDNTQFVPVTPSA